MYPRSWASIAKLSTICRANGVRDCWSRESPYANMADGLEIELEPNMDSSPTDTASGNARKEVPIRNPVIGEAQLPA